MRAFGAVVLIYKHARDFFAKELSAVPQSMLSLYGALAKTFSEAVVTKYGVTGLRALIRYERLTDEKLPKGDPGDFPIAIPRQEAGETVEKRFGDCTSAELEAAIRFAENPTDVPTPPDFAKTLDNVRKALQAVPNHNPFIVVSGRPVPGDFGSPGMRVTIKLPIEHFETLRDALDLAFPNTDEQAEADRRPAPRSKAPKRPIKRASTRGHASRGGLSHPRGSQQRGRTTARR